MSPADDLVPAEASKRRVLLLVGVRAELAQSAGDLDEVGRGRDLVDVAVAVEHVAEEADGGALAGGGGDVAVIVAAGAVVGADCVVVHADVGHDLEDLAGSSRGEEAGGAHLGRGSGVGAPNTELSVADCSP